MEDDGGAMVAKGIGGEEERGGDVGNGGSQDSWLNCWPDRTQALKAAREADAAACLLAALAARMIDSGLSTNGASIGCLSLRDVIHTFE
jgi:hypothetical protein